MGLRVDQLYVSFRCVVSADHQTIPWCIQRVQLHTIHPDEFMTASITSHGCNWSPDTGEVTTAPLTVLMFRRVKSETNWSTRHITGNEDDDYHEYSTPQFHLTNDKIPIQAIQLSSNTIPTSQLSTITIPSTYNGKSNRTPEWGHIENQVEVGDDFRVSAIMTTILSIWMRCTYFSLHVHLQLLQHLRSPLVEAFYGQPRDTLLGQRIPTQEHWYMNVPC